MQIYVIENKDIGIEKAKEILYNKINKKTVLFLSGGTTPKSLYEILAREKNIFPAAVGMIDERFGKKWNEDSNELMIKKTGLLDYLDDKNIPFYPILNGLNDRHRTAIAYDKTVRDLFFHFHTLIAITGIGSDGHTAGIPAGIPDSKFQIDSKDQSEFVVSYRSNRMIPPERVTMTFSGLNIIDFFIILVFGKDKKNALKKMFTPGEKKDIPARFYTQMADNKTVVITDQQV